MDAIERFRKRRELRLDINAYQLRKTERAEDNVKKKLDKIKGNGIINADAEEEWKEELHPRGKGGKFAKKGSGSHKSPPDDGEKHSEKKPEKSGSAPSEKPPKLAFDDPDSTELYKRIKSGDYLPLKELMEHPTVKRMGKKVRYYKEKYGSTSDIDTHERRQLRRKIKHEYLKSGSARVVEKDGERKVVYDGPLKKEHKACIVIGLAASGKSSRIVEPYSEANGAFVADCDRISEELPEYKATNGGAAGCGHKEARRLFLSGLKEFAKGKEKNGTNVVIPIIGAWMDDITEKIQFLEDNGYDVEVKYQDATPEESANRMVMRAIETGRIVPLGNVEKNGDLPKRNWEEIRKWGGGKYVKP